MVPEKQSGLLRVIGPLYEELGKPTTAEEWHTALLLPDDYEITHIEQVRRYFELRVHTWDIPINGEHRLSHVYLTPHYTRDNEQGVVTLTAMGISYTADIPVQAQKQKKIAIPDISTK